MAIEGDVRDLSLVDIVQLHCRRGDEAKVMLDNGAESGEIYFAGGQVVHAQQGAAQGREAFYQLLTWQEAHFVIETGVESPQATIEVPWTGLLMQTLQRIDEERGWAEDRRRQEETQGALHDLLRQLADRLDGFGSGLVADGDGQVLASLNVGEVLDENLARAMLFQTVQQTGETLRTMDAGRFEETITMTSDYRFILRPLEEEAEETDVYVQLILNADGNIGAARMYLAAFLATWPGLHDGDAVPDDAVPDDAEVETEIGIDFEL
jgi:predicted regulator of Ras-like GTPase activity (Roadblock/LC7/MglB family)